MWPYILPSYGCFHQACVPQQFSYVEFMPIDEERVEEARCIKQEAQLQISLQDWVQQHIGQDQDKRLRRVEELTRAGFETQVLVDV